ncbi:MAG: hypothetical protein LBT84_02290 [Spirochaetia bacterium]|jgi:hypothetical protein|nr:hypothetical protein [Spirochaetia bacterium]
MNFEKSNIWYFLAFIIIGAILGSALGTLLVRIFPGLSVITVSLTGPVGFSLEIISFSLKINLSAIAGLLAGVVLFRKI